MVVTALPVENTGIGSFQIVASFVRFFSFRWFSATPVIVVPVTGSRIHPGPRIAQILWIFDLLRRDNVFRHVAIIVSCGHTARASNLQIILLLLRPDNLLLPRLLPIVFILILALLDKLLRLIDIVWDVQFLVGLRLADQTCFVIVG